MKTFEEYLKGNSRQETGLREENKKEQLKTQIMHHLCLKGKTFFWYVRTKNVYHPHTRSEKCPPEKILAHWKWYQNEGWKYM